MNEWTTSLNIGGTNAWAFPHLKFWGDRPPSPPLGLRPWLRPLSFPLFVCVCWPESRPPPRLTESPIPTLFIHAPKRFVNSFPRRLSIVLRTRTIGFKGENFSKGIISYDSWGYVCTRRDRSTRSDWSGRIKLNTLYRKGDHFIWGIGYFVTPAPFLQISPNTDIHIDRYTDSLIGMP